VFLLAGLGLWALTGCSSGSGKYDVSGNVTFNGQPIPKGHIVFQPADNSSAPVGAPIQDGAYRLKAPAGKMRVEVHADREKVGAKVNSAMGAVDREDYIPPRYNAQTVLSAEVTAGGENQFNFPLTVKP
jgi:hypothetical protein